MNNVNLFFYIESNFVCSIFLVILLVRTVRGVDWQLQQTLFARVLFFYILYFIIDTVWIFFEAGVLKNNLLQFSLNILGYLVISASTFYWFDYSETVQGDKLILTKKYRVIMAIPLLFVVVFSIIFLCIIQFLLSEKIKISFYFYYYTVTTITPLYYFCLAFVKSLKRAFQKENINNKESFIMMGFYPIILFAGAIAQLFALHFPILCYVVVIDLLCVYLNRLDSLISIDSLTKLNNRNQFNRYLAKAIKENEGKKWLFFLDVDNFKKINDTYGHLEGDKALVIIANVLRESCKKGGNKFFIARYGGDEFIIIANARDIEDPKILKETIRRNLEKACKSSDIVYELTISIGVSFVDFYRESVEDCLKKADQELYNIKHLKSNRIYYIESSN